MGVPAGILCTRAGGVGCGLTALFVDFGNDNFGAFLGKALGGGAPNPAATAGDESNFSRQARHSDPFL
jgi:hypothetical protein